MNERILEYYNNLIVYFAKFSPQKKLMLASISGLILLGGIAAIVVMRQDPMQVLYTGLHAEDSKAIERKLGESKITYHITDEGSTISVPSSQVYKARMELAKEGLPGQDVVGFEKFDNSTLGMSNYVQRIQYIRAVQGELIRSIQRLNAVKTARVHISIPPKKTFLEEEEPPKASVILELKMGQTLSKAEVNGIAHLVSSAVEGLKVNQVTIVDTKGNFLHRPEDGNGGNITGVILDMQKNLESDYQTRVEEILTAVVGFGKVKAKVTVEIDPSRVNTTEETYDAEKAVARTITKNDELVNGSRPNPVGIPGSRSNLPGTEQNNPGVPMATNTSEKNTSNTNFAIPRKVQVIDKPSGGIKRLTVAVVVDGYYKKSGTPNTPDVFTPRTEEELKRLQDIVGNAVGFDAQRRDSITVSSLPFNVNDAPVVEEVLPVGFFDWKEFSKHGVRNGLIALLVVLFFFMILRPFLKWFATTEKENIIELMPSALPKTVSELEFVVQQQLGGKGPTMKKTIISMGKNGQPILDSDGKPVYIDVDMTPEEMAQAAASAANDADGNSTGNTNVENGEEGKKNEDLDLKGKIIEILNKYPKKGFRVVQDWLDEDGTPMAAEG